MIILICGAGSKGRMVLCFPWEGVCAFLNHFNYCDESFAELLDSGMKLYLKFSDLHQIPSVLLFIESSAVSLLHGKSKLVELVFVIPHISGWGWSW